MSDYQMPVYSVKESQSSKVVILRGYPFHLTPANIDPHLAPSSPDSETRWKLVSILTDTVGEDYSAVVLVFVK